MVGKEQVKQMAMTEYLERMRKKYPKAVICTNFGYIHQTLPMTDWKQIFTVRNGLDGVIFAIDEIQNEYNSASWKNFPEGLLAEITQQRETAYKNYWYISGIYKGCETASRTDI
uniref:hypothetical protein n=1 Tax=Streptococcus thermophilus TaxID=1308 RepID=UPI0015962BA3|nr:hypothetical protein [Streptococcus thermophilus]